MAFATFQEFFAMGGHAPYVWSAWGLTAVLLLGAVLHARVERRQVLRQLRRRVRREARQAGHAGEAQPIQTSRGRSTNEA
ncbi:heme exporter protein CcmD [Halomonas sp. MCCC 1A17488]|uniref:Heme exporter protein D n=1 Tax=Billgrantia sulfidoxydans TaxID=2733484 RepID=A0ABX7VZN1_9GAMM|nr:MULTISPECIES: heme exporter protein CcmD [Halomonas]MCE8016667.1 heme exporter protein CcmD [Halomonas sp. MCCC 1A17488]MCG3240000.1 heme exporter protein CcmD [Halomonas sp. MCCC 1A17488]QPP50111.1 heme exporter protein CcmD [Halomonas sp. SS10-MC5]QTP53723.1 heme exporter protein CcmD [Halomonas sulfidoxydans]